MSLTAYFIGLCNCATAGLVRGLAHGWLEADLVPAAEAGVARAWAGLAGRVAEDGTVSNIIGGGDQHWGH